MPLLSFLRNERPNPAGAPHWQITRRAADAPPAAPWVVVSRRSPSRRAAEAELLALPPEVRPLDVLRLAKDGRRAHWFVREDGRAVPLPAVRAALPRGQIAGDAEATAYGDDWPEAWARVDPDRAMELAAGAGLDPRPIVALACALARRALHFVRAGEERPRLAVECAEAWVRGGATDEALDEALAAAYRAANLGLPVWQWGQNAAWSAASVARAARPAPEDKFPVPGAPRRGAGMTARLARAAFGYRAYEDVMLAAGAAVDDPAARDANRGPAQAAKLAAEGVEREAQRPIVAAALPLAAVLLAATEPGRALPGAAPPKAAR